MAEIKASDVAKLRQMTGAGMMDCKNALVEAEGNFERASEIIREKGKLVAAKRADRDTKEGIVIARTTEDNTKGFLLCVGCETDFVSKNEGFQTFAKSISDLAINALPENLDSFMSLSNGSNTVEGMITEQTGKTGEKHQIPCYGKLEGGMLCAYNHMNGKVASLVAFNKPVDMEVAKNIAMQVAAMNPVSVNPSDCPKDVVEKELQIGREQARLDGKPEAMIEKIAEGKLNKFYKENTLLAQDFIKAENKESVEKYLQMIDKELKVLAFLRFSLND